MKIKMLLLNTLILGNVMYISAMKRRKTKKRKGNNTNPSTTALIRTITDRPQQPPQLSNSIKSGDVLRSRNGTVYTITRDDLHGTKVILTQAVPISYKPEKVKEGIIDNNSPDSPLYTHIANAKKTRISTTTDNN